MSADTETESDEKGAEGETPLTRLRARVLARWRSFPAEHEAELDEILSRALAESEAAPAEVITVMNPVSRPLRLRLGVLVTDAGLDTLYRQEWAELSVSREGRCYLIYRRRSGNHYAIEWSPTTTVPESMMNAMPEVLAMAMLEGDTDAGS